MAVSAAPAPTTAATARLPTLSFWRIMGMNVGFFGLQYSFGLQQTNMTPIYSYLGADPDKLPFLSMAGPITGLLVQPIVGALSDRTTSRWGRRTPFFIAGAIGCSLCLLLMPFSQAVWMAALTLWILDAANNVTQEPYRAFVSDQLPPEQLSLGFLTQSAFTGLGQMLANLTPFVLVALGVLSATARSANNIPYTTYAAFFIGAVVSIGAILISVFTTREKPLDAAQVAAIRATPGGLGGALRELGTALREMPPAMRQMAPMMLFNWYAIFCYWQYISLCLARTIYHTADPQAPGFAAAGLLTGLLNGGYNGVTFVSAFGLAWLARRLGARWVHLLSLAVAGLALLLLPSLDNKWLLVIPAVGLGIGWASMMGTTYAMLAGSIPKARTGVYMGIFNLFIVIPMFFQTLTFSWVYRHLLDSRPENAIRLAGALFLAAAAAVLLIKIPRSTDNSPSEAAAA